MFKKLVSTILALTFCFALSAGVLAQDGPTPYYINNVTVTSTVTCSGSEVEAYSKVKASSDVTKIVITHTLQKKSGSSFKDVSGTTVTKTFYDYIADMSDTFSAVSGATYRVKTVAKVTSPKGTDSVTKYSTAKAN